MADEVERVEYVFEGDVSSLRTASQTAIEMLGKYSDTMKKASSADAFTASQRSTKSMQASINRLTKDVSKMQAKLKSVGDVKLPTGSSASKAMTDTLKTLNSQMVQLSSVDTVTTKTLTGFRTELEGIRSRLQENSSQVDRLVASEQRFQTTLEAVQSKANSFRDSMTSMKSQLSGVFDPVSNKLKTFSTSFDSIGAKVQAFKDKATTSFGRVSQLAGTVASAFRRVSQDADNSDSAASRLARTHGVLSSSLSKLSSMFKRETTEIQNEKDKLKSKTPTLKETTSLHSKLSQTLKNLGTSFTKESRNSSVFGRSMKSLGSSSGVLKKAFQALTGVQIADWLAQGTKSAIDYIENVNLFNVAMGESVEAGHAFVKQMQEVYGMDPSNLYKYAGYFYQLTDAIGMSDKASATLSLSLTKASNDIASLFNVPIEQVVENLASGMQGMSRAVRKYGMDIRATTLQETAATYGLTQQVETMSEANRMALRYITMMNQVSNALNQVTTDEKGATVTLGDFAATIETPANQLRIFKEQISQLGRAIGNFFVKPLGVAIAYINGFVMALRMVLNFVAQTIGILKGGISKVDTSGTDKAAASVGGIGSAASDAAKKLKDLTAPFDELNVLQDTTDLGDIGGGGGGGTDDVLDPELEEALSNLELKLENIRMKANEVRDAILEFLGFNVDAGEIISWDPEKFENNLINRFPQWTQTIQSAFAHWSEIVEGFKAVFDAMGVVIDKVKEKLLNFFRIFINDETVSKFIDELGPRLQQLAGWIREHSELLANLIIILGVLSAAFPSLVVPFTVAATAIIGTIELLYTNSENFANSFNNLVKSFKTGLSTILDSIKKLFTTIWESLQRLWEEHVQPMLEQTGDALAPVLDTISVLWTYVSQVISDAVGLIEKLWVSVLEPVFGAVIDTIGNIMEVIGILWDEAIGPIVENVASSVVDLWESTLQPIIQNIIEIIGGIIEIVLALWNNVLIPVIEWLVKTLGPTLGSLINSIWDIVSNLFKLIGGVIKDLLTSLKGVIDFIAGVFTGDWKRAWKGIVNIFVGIGNLLIGIFENVVNYIIDLINGMISLIYNAVRTLINSILGAVEAIADVLGYNLNIRITAPPPRIGHLNIGRIPAMANGGVVTAPTYAMIGEGRYDEAIIPLGDSPQMQDLVQKIADEVSKERTPSNVNSDNPVEVRVFIGDREWDAFTYQSARRGEKLVGAQPVTIGG